MTATQRVVLASRDDPLELRGGGRLDQVEVAYETYGALSPARDNAVFVCHALTGDAHAASHPDAPPPDDRPGWWETLIGPGKALDTDRFFVISPNLLGGCSGTTGPGSTDPTTGVAYGPGFPLLHISDLVAAHRRLLDHLGIERLHAGVGGSLGGMQVLQWVLEEPGRIDRAVLVAASSQLTTENIAFSTVAREAILADPVHGMKVARMLAHITYVSPVSLDAKFGRRRDSVGPEQRMGPDFEVEHYLQHQGTSFLDRFDPHTYLVLSRLLDYFDPLGDPGAEAALRDAVTRFLLVSFDTDWRFSTEHSLRVQKHLLDAGLDATHHEIASPWGHDSFLLEPPGYHPLVKEFLES